ncbi:pre-rRNA-processing protein ESF1 [Thraustotheca clavata]|uniref:Pre-rRNA-processing protein ESF1 n=1 Tax=Thraustotheca clavata TaxID=74557 RepID=A0A1V9ZK78_9STRA|nr:pre-rRNA-processing protein ESF1 [Thraustotheca clavata]
MSPPQVVSDPRFSKVHNDPRFARNSKKRNKVQLDKRFQAVLTDTKFQSVQGKYDKYGRRIEKQENEMKKYYNLEEDEEEDDAEEKATELKKPMTAAEKRIAYLNKMARGELSDGSDTSESSDSEAEAEEEEQVEEEEEDIPMGEETKRIAVMNCDWSRMRAVDLFALFQSFVPASGAVHDVTIYPSDFGLEKMAEEEKYGPRGIFSDEKKEDAEESDVESDEESDEDDPLGVKKSASTEEEFDKEKLRQFELQKLKYYYAVATFNSVAAASAVFEQCDGLEYETSANTLDLRFVPDDVEFKNTLKESATSVPESYTPAIFSTLALQNTEIELTWEADDGERNERLTRIANWKELHDDDFAQYVASEASSEEEDEDSSKKVEKLKQKYRQALLEDNSDHDDNGFNDDFFGKDDGDNEGAKEMTFTPGAAILDAKKQKEREANETPFEKYQREKKLEKNQKKRNKKQDAKAAHAAQLEALKQAKKSKKKTPEVEGSDDDERNFDMKVISKVDKHKDKKGKHHKKELAKLQKASGLQTDFAFNTADERFGQLVNNNPDFSLDPTDARFKRTEATEAIFEARRQKQHTNNESNAPKQQENNQLKSLVDSLKRKSVNAPKHNKKQRF